MDSYDNQTVPRNCTVKTSGEYTGFIFFKHRWRDATSGPCLNGRVISGETHHRPCSEERYHFNKEIDIVLETGDTVQPGFIIYFTGENFQFPSMDFL